MEDQLYQSPSDHFIISSSLQILKDAHPKGLTIKELNEELLAAHKKDIQSLLKSSTILSTKLNAFYRKCQNLPPDFQDNNSDNNIIQNANPELPMRFRVCPMVRQHAPDNSKRLVYKYTNTVQDIPHQELDTTTLPNIPIMSPKSPLSPLRSEEDSSDEATPVPRDRLSPESSSASSSPYHLRRVIKKTAHAFVPPSIKRRSSSSTSSSAKRPRTLSSSPSKQSLVAPDYEELGGVNPYYDFPASPLVSTQPNTTSTTHQPEPCLVAPPALSDEVDWFSNTDDLVSPQLFSVDDLDSMFD